MTPTAVLNTLVAERIKIRALSGRRAVTPPPAATISSPLPAQAMGQRAEFSAMGPANLPLGLRDNTVGQGFNAGLPTVTRNWVTSRSSSSTQFGGDKDFITQIGGPSPKPTAVDTSAGTTGPPTASLNNVAANAVPAYGGTAFSDPNSGAGGNAGLFAGY